MNEKQYLEAVQDLLYDLSPYLYKSNYISHQSTLRETERRLAALKAQEDNIKSEMWKEKNPMVFDASIRKWRERTPADDRHVRDVLKEFGL